MKDVLLQVAAKAIIVHEGKVLIVRESADGAENTKAGQYQIVGGRLDLGEPFFDGLEREVFEETGLKVRYGYPLDIGEWWPVIKDVNRHIVALFCVCFSGTDKVKLSAEHDDYKWINPKDYATANIMHPDREVVQKYHKTTTAK